MDDQVNRRIAKGVAKEESKEDHAEHDDKRIQVSKETMARRWI